MSRRVGNNGDYPPSRPLFVEYSTDTQRYVDMVVHCHRECTSSCVHLLVSLLLRNPGVQRSEVTNELLVAIQSITDNKMDYKLVCTQYPSTLTALKSYSPGSNLQAVLSWYGFSLKPSINTCPRHPSLTRRPFQNQRCLVAPVA